MIEEDQRMFAFETYQGAINCFAQLNYVGQNNCIFYATNAVPTSALMFGAVGGAVYGASIAANNRNWAGYLLNVNEMGFGILPLESTKGLGIKPENLAPRFDQFFYIPYQQLASVTVKKYTIGSSIKRLIIEIANAPKFDLLVQVKENKMPYHQGCFKAFCDFYGSR